MPTKKTLEKDIASLKAGLNNPNIPENNKASMRASIQKLESQLAEMTEKPLSSATRPSVREKRAYVKKSTKNIAGNIQKDIASLKEGLNNPNIPEANKASMRITLEKLEAKLLENKKPTTQAESEKSSRKLISEKAKKYASKPSVSASGIKKPVSKKETPVKIQPSSSKGSKRGAKSAQILLNRYSGKGKLNNRGAYQNKPQNPNLSLELDGSKSNRAKPSGWRYTNAGAKRLKLAEGAEQGYVLKDHIRKYNGKYFTDSNGVKHRYIYIERREDKSDIKRNKPYLELGGEIEIEDGLRNHILNHLSSGYVGSRLDELGYQNGLDYKAIDKVKSKMLDILNEHGDEIYSIESLNSLIEDAAISLFGKNNLGVSYKNQTHYDKGGITEFSKGGRTNDRRHFNKAEAWEVRYNKKVGNTRKGYNKEAGGKINLPDYFDTGRNLDVFGYQTKYFINCPLATDEFEKAIDIINSSTEIGKKEMMSESLMGMAVDIDAIFKIEMESFESLEELSNELVFGAITHYLMQIGIYNFRSGMYVDTSFIHNHVVNIAENLCNKNSALIPEPEFEDGGEISQMIDGDGDMLLSQLKSIEHHSNELQSIVKPNMHVEAWVIAKMQRSATDLADVAHYLDYEEQ